LPGPLSGRRAIGAPSFFNADRSLNWKPGRGLPFPRLALNRCPYTPCREGTLVTVPMQLPWCQGIEAPKQRARDGDGLARWSARVTSRIKGMIKGNIHQLPTKGGPQEAVTCSRAAQYEAPVGESHRGLIRPVRRCKAID